MSFNAAPSSFFGPGYSLASSAITLKANAATGVTVGTSISSVNTTTDTITMTGAHGLLVGDRVRFTQVGTLPTGISAGVDYYVHSTPSTTEFTISSTKYGNKLDITAAGSGANTVQAMGPLDEISDAEANASSGDWRKVIYGIMEMLYQKWANTPSADRPTKCTIARSSSINESTGNITRYYTVTIQVNPGSPEVLSE